MARINHTTRLRAPQKKTSAKAEPKKVKSAHMKKKRSKEKKSRAQPSLRENFTTKLQGRQSKAPAANRTRAFPNSPARCSAPFLIFPFLFPITHHLLFSFLSYSSTQQVFLLCSSFLPGSNRRPLRCNDCLLRLLAQRSAD